MRMFCEWAMGVIVMMSPGLLHTQLLSIPDAPAPQQEKLPTVPPMVTVPVETGCASLRGQSAKANAKRDYAAVIVALKEAVTVCSQKADILVELARAEMLTNQFDTSANILHDLLREDPRNVQALLTQGELFYLIGETSQAITSLSQAIVIAPGSAEPYYLLGRVYYQQSSLQLAKVQFKTALQLDANMYKAYDGLALCYENMGETKQAADSYMKGIEIVYKAYPDYDVIYADFAELMLRFNESQKALELAAEAAQRNPHAPRNYLLAGRALEQAGRYQDSLRWLLKAAEMDSAYPDPHLQLARVYKRLGNTTKSKQEAELFAQLSAKTSQVKR